MGTAVLNSRCWVSYCNGYYVKIELNEKTLYQQHIMRKFVFNSKFQLINPETRFYLHI